MGNKVCLLLIYCAIFVSIGTLTEGDKKSSDLLVRKKRLISRVSHGNKPLPLHQVPYVVNILMNGVHACGGSILTSNIVLTAAHCLDDHIGNYTILSGSPYVDRGTHHDIRRILMHKKFHPKKYSADLAMFIISPSIDFVHSPNRRILLYHGHVPPNTLGTISGWGSICERGKIIFPKEIRSITVPTISQEQCRRDFHGDQEITNEVICTFDRIQGKRCSYGDSGNPLVIHGQLAGVMAWNLEGEEGPDVFMNLSHPEYRNWILSNIQQL